jgi:uncharacterized membrane protein YdjX (TVP38/TMEM64 family)
MKDYICLCELRAAFLPELSIYWTKNRLFDLCRGKSEAMMLANNRNTWWKPAALLVVVITLFILAKVSNFDDQFLNLRHWIQATGYMGMMVFVLIYAAGAVAVVPGTALTIAGGAIFGSIIGIVVVSIGSTLGAALAFAVSRYFARKSLERWLSGNDTFRRLDLLLERHGAIVVAFTRLVPLFPYNLLNYGFGLTRVPFETYLFWTWLCMLPETILMVVGADALTIGIAEGAIPWRLVGVFTVIAILLVFLAHMARKKLDKGGK